MDLKLFIKTAPWLPVFMLAGYAIPQFVFETNQLYGFVGMVGGLVLWIVFLMIAYVKNED